MLRFLYTTDLHGDTARYETVLNFAITHDFKIIHMGADLLPKGSGILTIQKTFVNNYLKKFYHQCSAHGITAIASFGNDDIYTRKTYFRKYATLLDETPYLCDQYEFKAYNFVPVYPFSLRTACKNDSDDWVYTDKDCPTMDVGPEGFIHIADPDKYFKEKGTIKGDLDQIKGHKNLIMAIHCPPAGLSLDVCLDGRAVGSQAVTTWIQKNQPLLTLHGHIHENLNVTGNWKVMLGRTTIIQPGPNMVVIEINDDKVHCQLIKL